MKINKLFFASLAILATLVGCKDKEEPATAPSLSLDRTEVELVKAGESVTISLTSNRDWTATPSDEWIAVDPKSGSASADAQSVTITVLPNKGNNRTGSISFSIGLATKSIKISQAGEGGAVQEGDGTKDAPYTVAKALEIVNALGADQQTETAIYVKGIVCSLRDNADAIKTYGNASYYISDDGTDTKDGRIMIFQSYYLGNVKFTSEDQIKVGDEVVVYGKFTNYKGNTPETVGKGSSYIYSLNGSTESGGGDVEKSEVSGTVVAVCGYGVLIKTADNSIVYAYGAPNTTVVIGDKVTISGSSTEFNGVPEYKDYTVTVNSNGTYTQPDAVAIDVATFDALGTDKLFNYYSFSGKLTISGNYYNVDVAGAARTGSLSSPTVDASWGGKIIDIKGYFVGTTSDNSYNNFIATDIALSANQDTGEDVPAPEVYTSNVTWTLGSNAYSEKATINGSKESIEVLKLGKSAEAGTAEIVIPSGSTKVNFYGVSWKNKKATLSVKLGGQEIYSKMLRANDGASEKEPYTLTVSGSDYYTITLPAALTENTTVTVTTTGQNNRVILFGINAE